MAHKIRKAMADKDARYSLAYLVEMDDSFFEPKGTKRGRWTEQKSTVLCAVSLYRELQGEDQPAFAHMQVVDNASADTIECFLESLECISTTKEGHNLLKAIRANRWRSYGRVAKNRDMSHCQVAFEIPKPQESFFPGFIGLFPILKP